MKVNKKLIIIIVIFLFVLIGGVFIYEKKITSTDALKSLSLSNKIIVKKIDSDLSKYNYYKTITDKTQINNINDILSQCSEFNGWKNLSRSLDTYLLIFYDSDDKIIANVIFDSSGYFNIDYKNRMFYFKIDETSKLNDLLK
jgi:hypothetical protein